MLYPPEEEAEARPPVDIWLLARKYWLLSLLLMILGSAGGAASVIFSVPLYKASVLLEVENVSDAWLKNSVNVTTFEGNEVNIQTQLDILRGGSFRNRGAERVRSEVIPLPPPVRGVFSTLRERLRPSMRDPLLSTRRALDMAMETFDARPHNKTRLIEMTCESTSPRVGAMFLNAMASEFVDYTSQANAQGSQKTRDILSARTEEAKSKLHTAEDELRNFVQTSGNLFAGAETATLADVQLTQAKNKLAEAQSLRIQAQTRYEVSQKVPPESLTEVQNNGPLRGYQTQISNLNQQKAALLVTFTAKHEKVRLIDAQLEPLVRTYRQELDAVLRKIRDDYEAAKREERHRAEDCAAKAQQVGAETGKAAKYTEMKREVENLRLMYQSLLSHANEAGVSNASTIKPIRIVEPSTPAGAPYKPRPALNLSFGTLLGLVAAGGLVFLRERTDRSVRSPGSMRQWMNVPELGVIPNLYAGVNAMPVLEAAAPPAGANSLLPAPVQQETTALASWRNAPAFVTESFRGTLASILRVQQNGRPLKVLLVTSPGPGEGKTTVVQNLGMALAETGRKILLIDADFRRPHLHKRFHLPNDRSLIDFLADDGGPEAELKYMGISTGIPGMFVLPNRPTDSHVAKALYSPKLRSFFHKLRDAYDMILVDAPPFLHLADARIVAPLTDGTVLVLRSGATSREHALEANRRIREDGLFLIGTILTAWEASNSYLKRHYYYYDYADEKRP